MTYYLQKLHNTLSDDNRFNGIGNYCRQFNIDLQYVESANVLEFHLYSVPNDLDVPLLAQLEQIPWNNLQGKRLFIFHHGLIHLNDISQYLNSKILEFNLFNQVYFYTYNPYDVSRKELFHFIYINSISQTLIEINSMPSRDGEYSLFQPFDKMSFDNASSHYSCLSHAIKPHRHFFYSLLKKNNLLSFGDISFNQCDDFLSYDGYDYSHPFFNNLKYLSKDYLDSTQKDVIHYDSYMEESDDIYTVAKSRFNSRLHSSSLVSLVQEATCNQNDIFLTEKTHLPLVSGKPLLLVSNYRSLRFLKSYFGIKTFSDIFDESYDEIYDPLERTFTVFKELEKFCLLPFAEAKERVESLQPIYDYNRDIMFNYSHEKQFRSVLNKIFID